MPYSIDSCRIQPRGPKCLGRGFLLARAFGPERFGEGGEFLGPQTIRQKVDQASLQGPGFEGAEFAGPDIVGRAACREKLACKCTL